MKKKLYIDFDGVLADTVRAICQMYVEDYSLYAEFDVVAPEEIDTWDFEELDLLSDQMLHHYFNTGRFFTCLYPIDKQAVDYLKELSKFYDIRICTIGQPENLHGKQEWFSIEYMDVAQDIPIIGILDCDKSAIDMSDAIVVDDSQDMLDSTNAAIKICFGPEKGWNKDWEGVRCKGWKELKDFLMERIHNEEESW